MLGEPVGSQGGVYGGNATIGDLQHRRRRGVLVGFLVGDPQRAVRRHENTIGKDVIRGLD